MNDSPDAMANCIMKKDYLRNGFPVLVLQAKKDIPAYMELRYDYGDPKNLYWRNDVSVLHSNSFLFPPAIL